MEKFTITKEIIEKATDYIPLAEKQAIAKVIAENSIEPIEMSVLSVQADSTLALPQRYEENWLLKKLYLAQYFLTEYLHIESSENFSVKDYDNFFNAHPFEQLERLKRNKEIADKVFDILADYGELKKLTEVEIYNAKAARNDTLERFLAGITVLSTPENLEAMVKELKKATDDLSLAKAEIKKKTAKKQVTEKTTETKAE